MKSKRSSFALLLVVSLVWNITALFLPALPALAAPFTLPQLSPNHRLDTFAQLPSDFELNQRQTNRIANSIASGWTDNSTHIVSHTNSNEVAFPVTIGSNRTVDATYESIVAKVSSTSATCVPPPSGLVGWWSGNGSADDNISANHGMLRNGATFGAGKVGAAFVLDGVDDYVSIGNPASLKLVDSITLAAWVNPRTAPPPDDPSLSGIYAIVTKWGQSVDFADSYGIWLHNPDGSTRLVSGIILDGPNGRGLYRGGVIPSGAWSHVAVTYDRTSGVQRIYVNAAPVGEDQASGGIRTSDSMVLIGKEDSSLPRFFNGAIDEVQIYDRALTGGEIQAIYDADSAGLCQSGSHSPPVTTASVNPSPDAQGVYPGPVTVSLSASASSGYTVNATYYIIDGGATQSYTGPFVVAGGGSHIVSYWSVDNAGVTETPNNLSLPIDSLRIATESPLPNGTVGAPYSTQLAAAGGTPPYHWSLAAGALPQGLALDESTGVISGMPSAAGTFGFTIMVTDSTMATAKKPFDIAPPPPSGSSDTDYRSTINIDPAPGSGGTDPGVCAKYVVLAGALPDGLSLDESTGVVSGKPRAGGTYNFTIGCLVSGGQNAGQTVTKDFSITIYNPAPTIASLDPAYARAGGSAFLLNVNGTNFVPASIVYWNGASRPTTPVSPTKLQAMIDAADTANSGVASVTVVNPGPGGGVSNVAAFNIIPANQPPTVGAGGPYWVTEGGSATLTATGNDPDNGALLYAWDLDGDGRFETPGQSVTFSASALDGPSVRTATVQVTDNGGLTASASTLVEVKNAAPTIVGAITAALDPVPVKTSINTNVRFSDPGVLDTHTALWEWDDGTTSAGTVQETNGFGSVSGSHPYTTAGIYTVKVIVTDDDGLSDDEVFLYVVIYDPSAGFVTGGGWIDSPAGAYTPDPNLTGKANFGFVAKYEKGATKPTGQTEFQFRVAGLNFHSSSYDWLVVAGAKAQYKGLGTINENGNYGFMLTAIDSAVSGGGDSDKFRIRIWDRNSNDAIIYDNKIGEAVDSGAATQIGGGSIVIQQGKK